MRQSGRPCCYWIPVSMDARRSRPGHRVSSLPRHRQAHRGQHSLTTWACRERESEIRKRAVVACGEKRDPATTTLVLGALNAMFDITTKRAAAARMHPPLVVFGLLFVLALASAFVAGTASATRAGRLQGNRARNRDNGIETALPRRWFEPGFSADMRSSRRSPRCNPPAHGGPPEKGHERCNSPPSDDKTTSGSLAAAAADREAVPRTCPAEASWHARAPGSSQQLVQPMAILESVERFTTPPRSARDCATRIAGDGYDVPRADSPVVEPRDLPRCARCACLLR